MIDPKQAFERKVLATRILVEVRFGRPIEAAPHPDEPERAENLSWLLADALRGFDLGKSEQAHWTLGFVQGILMTQGTPKSEIELANRNEP